MRLIDADEFYRILENKSTMDEICLLSHTFSLKELAHILYNQPTVEERQKGKWIEEELSLPLSDSTRTAYRCSNCTLHFDSPTKYCPNCGSFNKADM